MQTAMTLPTIALRRDEQRSRPAARLAFGWLVPSIADIIFMICIGVTVMFGARFVSADGDASRHLTVGEHMLVTGDILREDVFSHTRGGDRFVPYEWLAETTSALTHRVAGLAGPVLLHGAAIGLSFALLYAHLRRRGHPVLLALAVTLVAAAASSLHWLARPHVFTFLGTAFFTTILAQWHAGQSNRRTLWLLPLAMLPWVNAHGGFLIGLILVGGYAGADLTVALASTSEAVQVARRRLHDLALPALAIIVATLFNPAGPALYEHVTGYFSKKLLVNRTHEYLSPDFHQGDALPFLAMLIALVLGVAWSRRRLALHEGLLCAGFTYFALHSARNIPLFAIVVTPILAAQLASFRIPAMGSRWEHVREALTRFVAKRNEVYARMEGQSRWRLWPVLMVTALMLVSVAQARAGEAPLSVRFDPKLQPVAAVRQLKASLPDGNGYNELVWGGYLLHELWPAKRVFIDGQTDFYGEELTRAYLRVAELSEGWQSVLDRYDVRWVIYPSDTPLVRALAGTPGWQISYADKVATVLVRRESVR